MVVIKIKRVVIKIGGHIKLNESGNQDKGSGPKTANNGCMLNLSVLARTTSNIGS